MAGITLRKFLRKQSELQQALTSLLDESGSIVLDVDGSLLAGSTLEVEQAMHPVIFEGETVGWTQGRERAADAAKLLVFLLNQEGEKKSLAGELIDRYRELNLLYHLSERMAVSPDPEAIASAALEETTRLIRATSAMIILYQPGTTVLQPVAVCGFPYQLSSTCCVIERVLETGRADLANAVPGDDYFLEAKGQRISMMCAPLKTEKGNLGALLLVSDPERVFTAGDLKLLNTVALQVAPAIEITRLTQVAVEKARIEQELQMARQVLESLMPVELPALDGWSFACRWRPAREVSGDFYDIIAEGEPFSEDETFIEGDSFIEDDTFAQYAQKLGLVIADVTDKGMPAALFSVFTRSALHASIDQNRTPAETITHTNRLICQDSHQGLFVTLFYARLEIDSGQFTFVNAGHNPPLFYSTRQQEISLLTRTGLPLGIELDQVYGQSQVRLEPGDFVLFYTDGITEAMNAANKEFGMQRLREVIYEHKEESTGQILDAVERALEMYTGPVPAFDDVTMMIVRRV